jgi:hypothetical protein
MSKHDDTDDDSQTAKPQGYSNFKEAVHERDRQRCTNCLGSREIINKLDVDHNVPRGVGGSEAFQNQSSLCRRCHEAKEGNGIAPTVQFESTGRMTQTEFIWFRHFLKEILPALARVYRVRLRPKFKLDDRQAWYISLGDLRRLDSHISDEDNQYCSLQVSEYM